MTAVKLTNFGGMVPRMGFQTLPDQYASHASNALLLSGELRGIRSKYVVEDLRSVPFPIERLYRIKSEDHGTSWVPFDDPTVDFVKGPLTNDIYERYYWTSENHAPMMNTRAGIDTDQPPILLGIPAPILPNFSVTPSGGTGPEVTRAYVVTYVSSMNEEGPPCGDPAIATGNDDGSWLLENMNGTIDQEADRRIVYKNVYRTVTSVFGTVEYHFVAQIPFNQDSWTDNYSTDEVASNTVLQSQKYEPPPDNIRGLVAHPNGFLVAFVGRDIHFSEPYRPHAWPPDYVLSCQDEISGLGIYASSIAIPTGGHPVIATGIRPDGISLRKAQTADPCIAGRRSIVAMPFGVYYPSDNGLMLISAAGFNLATQKIITKTEWQKDYFPSQLDAVRWETQYVSFYNQDQGFMFAPDEPTAGFVELGESSWTHTLIQNDALTGDVFLVQDNIVYEWNPAHGAPTRYSWTSKEFVTPKPVNFGAVALEFSSFEGLPEEELDRLREFNEERIKYPLNPICHHALASVRPMSTLPGYSGKPSVPGVPENKQPFHDSPLYDIDWLGGGSGGGSGGYTGDLRFTLYADDVEVASFPVTDHEQYKLPAGYKARRWRFRFDGNVDLKSMKIAETGTELADV